MTGHDEAFAAFRERREAERAATVKVTWRKISPMTGGGWSGIGPQGKDALVFVNEARPATKEDGIGHGWSFATVYDYGRIVAGERVIEGSATLRRKAQERAAALLGASEPTKDRA